MPPGQDKFKSAAAGLSEKRRGIIFDPTAVFVDVVQDFVEKLRVVKISEYFPGHGLLIRREEFPDAHRRNAPVVVHTRAQRMVKRKRHPWLLLWRQTLEQRGHQCFGGCP